MTLAETRHAQIAGFVETFIHMTTSPVNSEKVLRRRLNRLAVSIFNAGRLASLDELKLMTNNDRLGPFIEVKDLDRLVDGYFDVLLEQILSTEGAAVVLRKVQGTDPKDTGKLRDRAVSKAKR